VPAAIGLVDLGVLLALALLIALSYAYRYTLGAVIVALANAIGAIRLPGIFGGGRVFGFAADELTKIDHAIQHQLGVGIAAMQAVWNECVSYTATAVHWVGKEIASLAHDTAQAVEGLSVGAIPKWAKKELLALAAFGPIGSLIYTFRRQIAHALSVAKREALHLIRAAEHAVVVKSAAVAGALPFPRIGRIEHDLSGVEKWVRARGKLLTVAGISALLIGALGRLGLGWTRCSNVGKLGKNVCGMNPSLLESLLADTLLIVGTVSLVEFAKGMQGITGEVVGPVRTFWRAS
jgi:hypothetical protein